ncbi:MAG: serine/threonine protein kinase [Bacteroidaceae bacterium]|nr:serine/threonine protein kinase [Bacteroidaceae bacterium]
MATSDTRHTLAQGERLKGSAYTYEIIRTLGQGAFGITYLARIQVKAELGSISTHVAVKEFYMSEVNGRQGATVTYSSDGGLFGKYREKFVNEAVRLSRLSHPNIVKVLETFEANNTVYYSMEYIEGGTLDSRIQESGGLEEREALELTLGISEALAELHSHNMLHLDLKPGNIMLRDGKTPVLIDFGLSKQYDKEGNPESSTSIGGGTPGYSPIEQMHYTGDNTGDLPVTMDIYALGATMFKMLTARRPPEAPVILNEGFPDEALAGVSQPVLRLITAAMRPLRRDRTQTMGDFRRMLAEIMDVGATDNEEETTQVEAQTHAAPEEHKADPQPTIADTDTGGRAGCFSRLKSGLYLWVRAMIIFIACISVKYFLGGYLASDSDGCETVEMADSVMVDDVEVDDVWVYADSCAVFEEDSCVAE